MPLQLLLIDDHDLFRTGLQLILKNLDDELHILESRDCSGALAVLENNLDIDLIMLDLILPDALQFECFDKLIAANPSIPLIILSATEDKLLAESAIKKGAQGYIPKSYSNDVILNVIRLVLSGGIYMPPISFQGQLPGSNGGSTVHLTARQKQVLGLIDQGFSNKQIAQMLEMTEGTVKAHVTAIFRTLNVENRVSACNIARQMSLI